MAESNKQLIRLFRQMSEMTEILGGNRFRIIAFENTARVLGELTEDVAEMSDQELASIDGIGEGTRKRIHEYLDTGKIADHEKLMQQVPKGLLDLLDVPNMGAKTVAKLWQEAGVTDLESFKAKLETGELEKLKGFGKKKLEQLKQNLAFIESAGKRARIGQAMPLAHWFVEQLRKVKGVKQAAFAGSLRRGKETIGDIDLLVAAEKRDAHKIADSFAGLEVVEQVLMKGATKTSVRTSEGLQVDLRVVEPGSFGAALLYFTGSKEHNVRLRERAIGMGYKLSEYGLFKEGKDKPAAGKSEDQVYEKLKLAWIPPELRENRGEIALAEKGALPKLIELSDIKAELHAHTTASDGHWSIRELAAAAADRGFHTLAVTDHSKSQVQANGLDAKRLAKHIEAIGAVAEEMKGTIRVLAGTEVDILADGKLDYPDSVLKQLDVVVASPHAALAQDAKKCTERLLKAIDNRYVTILGHPTGRLVNRREGLHPDMKKVLAAAAQRGIALEINANHYRLDLRDTHARAAIEAGCKLAINTDAHGPADLDQLLYGVLTARRAGATQKDVINCMSQSTLAQWIKSTRG